MHYIALYPPISAQPPHIVIEIYEELRNKLNANQLNNQDSDVCIKFAEFLNTYDYKIEVDDVEFKAEITTISNEGIQSGFLKMMQGIDEISHSLMICDKGGVAFAFSAMSLQFVESLSKIQMVGIDKLKI